MKEKFYVKYVSGIFDAGNIECRGLIVETASMVNVNGLNMVKRQSGWLTLVSEEAESFGDGTTISVNELPGNWKLGERIEGTNLSLVLPSAEKEETKKK